MSPSSSIPISIPQNFVNIQAMIDALSAHLCILDEQGVIMMVNRAWREFAAKNPPIPPGDFIGVKYLQVCDRATGPDSAEAAAFAKGLRSVMRAEKEHFQLEYPCHSPEKQGWYIARVTRYPGNDPFHIVIAHEDITQRKLAEIALREREERLEFALQGANDGLWDWNMVTGEVYFSPRWKSMLGYAQNELASSHDTWQQLVHPDDVEPILEKFYELTSGCKDRFHAEFRLRHKDGHYVDVLSRAFKVERDNGAVVRLVGTQVDISLRKQAERALSESEYKFRSYIENAPDAVFVVDKEERCIDFNPKASQLLGYAADELLGLRISDVTHEEDLPLIYQGLAPMGTSGYYESEVRLRKKTGQIVWINFRSVKLSGDHYLAYCQDITERKQMEEALHRNQAMLMDAVKIAHLAYWEYDVASDLFTFNDPFYAIFHTTAEQEGGYSMSSTCYAGRFVHPDDRDLVAVEIQKVLSSTAPLYSAQVDHKIRYADGETGYISVRITGIRNENGKIVKTSGVNQDITDRKRKEEEARMRAVRSDALTQISKLLSDSTANYHELLGQLSRLGAELVNGAFAIRLVTDDGQWLKPVALSLTGREPVDAEKLIETKGDLPADHGVNGRVLQTGEVVVYPHISPDELDSLVHPFTQGWIQEYTIYSLVTAPLRARGFIIGTLSAYRLSPEYPFTNEDADFLESVADQAAMAIMNARLIEQIQRQNTGLEQRVNERTADLQIANAELVRASRVKDEFLASMSHELRTPLNAILMLSESFQEGIYGPLSNRQAERIGNIGESGQHLLSLINDILDLSKIEAGKVELEMVTVGVDMLCQACMQLVKQQAVKKRLQVSLRIDPQIQRIQASERHIKQILVNLLSNAVKFTPDGGQMGLEVHGDTDQQVVRFTVWDTGIGIAPDQVSRLFQPFVQLDSRLSRQYEGTGLGLALVARLTRLHGGSVSLQSTPDEGSRFTVSLPWSG